MDEEYDVIVCGTGCGLSAMDVLKPHDCRWL